MNLKHYALTPPIVEFPLAQGINNTIVGLRTGCGEYALKHIKAPHDLKGVYYEHTLLRWLAKQSLSFAVPAPIETTDGCTLYQDANGYHILMPLLSGERIDHHNPTHIKTMGMALGELQATLSTYPTTPRPHAVSFSDLENIHPLVPDPRSLTPKDVGWLETPTANNLCA